MQSSSTTRRHLVVTVSLLTLCLACSSSAQNGPADSLITSWIQKALVDDARVDSGGISVHTQEGIVTLAGTVDSIAARQFADLEAKKIHGVLGVVNQLAVAATHRGDIELAQDVRRRILNSATIHANSIDVSAVKGVVTLRGRVSSWQEREEAGLLASFTQGVLDLKNQLRSEYGPTRSDADIKNDAVAALSRDVYLSALPITVTVKAGEIMLSGSVGSAYEKHRAETDVRWLSHAKGVDNGLLVSFRENRGARRSAPGTPSDVDLQSTVREAIRQDLRIDSSRVSVTASVGFVTLKGSVPNHRQKQLAEEDARDVVGVAWVTNQIRADVDRREDSAIREEVLFALSIDSTLRSEDIDIEVKDGVASLEGQVGSWYEHQHAGAVAGGVRGVAGVDNRITVRWNQGRDDRRAARDLQAALLSNATTSPVVGQISVEVTNGVARLTGRVDTWAERNEALRLAWRTSGVRRVENHLAVKRYDYPWERWQSEDFPAYDAPGPLYDWDYWQHWG